MNRRQLLQSAAAATVTLGFGSPFAHAQENYPSRVVTVVIPYPPGGPTDLLGRLVADGLANLWGKPVVAENKPGASGTIGGDIVARAAPDGYTLVLGNNASHGTYELLNPHTTPYITLRDFAPVSLIGLAPQVMIISTGAGPKDLKSFLEFARENPGKLNYGSSAIGSSPHLAAEMLKLAAGVDITHIPFNGAAPVMQAIVANTVQMYIGAPSTVMPQVEAGKAIAVGALSAERIPSLPDVPTFRENGVDIVYNSWFGLLAPAATPPEILDKINADITTLLQKPEIQTQLANLGFIAETGTREEFTQMLKDEGEKTKQTIEAAKIEVEKKP
jgi:tripartite-type tricarboxylate transporter receptor subunit TctC